MAEAAVDVSQGVQRAMQLDQHSRSVRVPQSSHFSCLSVSYGHVVGFQGIFIISFLEILVSQQSELLRLFVTLFVPENGELGEVETAKGH